MLETGTYRDYHSGLAAIDRWIEQLEAIDQDNEDEESFAGAMHANWWMYQSLLSARRFAPVYLRAHIESFGLPADRVEALSAVYEREVELLKADYEHVPATMTGHRPADWTPDVRHRQIETLGKLRSMEEEALAILRQV